MTRAALDALIGRWSPKILWVTLSLVIPFTVTTSYRVGAQVAQHEALDTLILRRLDAIDARAARNSGKIDSIKTTVDSMKWLMQDRQLRLPPNPLRP